MVESLLTLMNLTLMLTVMTGTMHESDGKQELHTDKSIITYKHTIIVEETMEDEGFPPDACGMAGRCQSLRRVYMAIFRLAYMSNKREGNGLVWAKDDWPPQWEL